MSILVKTTLAEQAYQELRSRIISGELVGGTRLLPSELAAALGISPTPVKEACMMLEVDGLVVSSSRRGMIVRQFTEDDVYELYDARMMLEKAALEWAFANDRITDELIAALTGSFERHREFASGSTQDELSQALSHDRQFHRHLVAAAGVGLVAEWHERAMRHLVAAGGIGLVSEWHDRTARPADPAFVSVAGYDARSVEAYYGHSVDQHREILDAVAARSLSQSIEALTRHLTLSRENTLMQIQRLKHHTP